MAVGTKNFQVTISWKTTENTVVIVTNEDTDAGAICTALTTAPVTSINDDIISVAVELYAGALVAGS